jgi:hypothetical protein
MVPGTRSSFDWYRDWSNTNSRAKGKWNKEKCIGLTKYIVREKKENGQFGWIGPVYSTATTIAEPAASNGGEQPSVA